MQFVYSWWNWCTESFGHMFAGVTAPILLISALAIVFIAGSGGGDGGVPLPPRSDVAGVCINTTPTSEGSTDCGTTVTGLTVQTPTPVPPTATPKPRSYTVRAGDTLYAICAAEASDMSLDDCVAAIVDLSDLAGPDQLTEGQVITLPPPAGPTSSRSSTTPRNTPTPVVAEPTVATQPEPEPTEVVEEVEEAPAPQASLVAVGPQQVEDEPATPPENGAGPDLGSTPTAEELAAGEGTEYTVEDGDSLYGICVAYVPDMPEDECIEFVVLLNDLAGPDEIRSGQVLILP